MPRPDYIADPARPIVTYHTNEDFTVHEDREIEFATILATLDAGEPALFDAEDAWNGVIEEFAAITGKLKSLGIPFVFHALLRVESDGEGTNHHGITAHNSFPVNCPGFINLSLALVAGSGGNVHPDPGNPGSYHIVAVRDENQRAIADALISGTSAN